MTQDVSSRDDASSREDVSSPNDALSGFADDDAQAPVRAAQFLKSLAHKDRLKVLCVLLDAELSVSAIEARVGASQSAVSQHLARLKDEGVVKSRRDGRQAIYSIADPMVLEIVEILYRRFCAPD